MVLLKAEAAAGGDLRTVISRTVYLAGGIDRKVVQDIELIIMVDEIADRTTSRNLFFAA